MTGTYLCVNLGTSVPVIFEPPFINKHDVRNYLYVVLMESVLTTPNSFIVLFQFVLMTLKILFTLNNAVIYTTAVAWSPLQN